MLLCFLIEKCPSFDNPPYLLRCLNYLKLSVIKYACLRDNPHSVLRCSVMADHLLAWRVHILIRLAIHVLTFWVTRAVPVVYQKTRFPCPGSPYMPQQKMARSFPKVTHGAPSLRTARYPIYQEDRFLDCGGIRKFITFLHKNDILCVWDLFETILV